MKLECDVIRDLLPLYAEKLASPASSALVEQHLSECPACRAELEQMEKPVPVQPEPQPDAPLKNIRSSLNRRRLRTMLCSFAAALALAAVLMVWSVLGGAGSASSSSMEYSTVVHYFESLQVTQFSLDLNTGVITMNLKEGGKNNLPLPDTTSQSTTQATGGLLSGMLSSSDEDTAAQKNSDGTVTVRYKLPYAYVFIENVQQYAEIILRLKVSSDPEEYKNSIITMWSISQKRFRRLLRQSEILYKKG